jgi:molybdopterin converting factor small subunit
MSRATIKIPSHLRRFVAGADNIVASGETISDVLHSIENEHHGILNNILTPDGKPRVFINIYLDRENIRNLQGLATPLHSDHTIMIIHAIAGG